MKHSRRKRILFLTISLLACLTLAGCQKAYLKKGSPDCPPGNHLSVKYDNDLNLIFQECKDSKGRNQGRHFIRYPSGKLKMDGHYKNGIPHGKFIEWYENGNIKSEFESDHGAPAGTNRYWGEDGSLLRIEKFYTRDNKRMKLTLYGNGNRKSEGEIEKFSSRKGKWKFWHENGQLAEEGEYVDSKKNGLWIEYDEDGREIKKIYYKNGIETEKDE